MSMIATYSDKALPRLSKREFTLCKAALLVALIAIGQWTSHVQAGEAGTGPLWTSVFCDGNAADRAV
ncbi:hypothetical protein SAMN05421759_1262 [Roseivivax lentus]|uniref:Uncharacterized protein n=1 Tax=Roseivivax lentus TaxID=633194 RepID=A0A1N7Q321_9RHOB|nr:hypothetical protein [Roseivivax lentus]SIT17225.1 hypothetical protein SAMN05421759_1262 [Roseivivax lentus]